MIRTNLPDSYKTEAGKLRAIVAEIRASSQRSAGACRYRRYYQEWAFGGAS